MEENVKKNGRNKPGVEEKWRIYQEAAVPGAPVGELLRKYGMYPAELAKIKQSVEKRGKGRARAEQIPEETA